MTSNPNIIRFESNGPADQPLKQIHEITSDDVEGDVPTEMAHEYYASEDGSLTAGVWHCTPHTLRLAPYPVDEFMFVLEGSVAIVHEDGHEEVFRAGDAFVIPRGLRCAWKQTESIRKYYVIYEDPKTGIPEKPVTDRAIRLEPNGPAGTGLTKLDLAASNNFNGEPPTQYDHGYFEDAAERQFAGIWTCTPMDRIAQRFGRFEVMCLLEGGMTLTDDAGVKHEFRAPNVLLELPDAVTAWKSTEFVRKYYYIFEA